MSDLLQILVLGVGSIGERHLRCFQTTKRCDVAFVEPMEERRRDVSDRYSVTGYPSWKEAVDAAEFDAAVIAAPAPYHIPTATELAQ